MVKENRLERYFNFCRLSFLFFLSVFLTGCGYTFQGTGSVLPPDVKRIYIPIAENNSTEPGVSTLLTEALRDRFDRYGAVTVVDEISDSDAVLKTKILRVKKDTASVASKSDTALSFDVTMTVAVELRRVTGAVLWRQPELSVTKSYGANSSVVVTNSADFFSGSIGAGDLASLQAGGTREIARGQQSEAFNYITDQVAKIIYDSAVAPDF